MIGLSGGLIRLGHRVFAYGHGDPERGGSEEVLRRAKGLGIEVPDLRHGRATAATVKRRLLASLASNDDGLDVVLVHGMFRGFSRPVARASSRSGVPCIACPHDPYSPALFGTRRVLKRAYWRLFEGPFLRSVRAVHVLAPSHIRYLKELGVSVPTFVVPNGLDAEQLEAANRTAVDHGPADFSPEKGRDRCVLYLGRLDVYNKGLDLLLQALAEDREAPSGVRLQIAGRGSERDRLQLLELISSLQLDDRVSVVGFVSDARSAMRAADLVVLPSRFDGFGQVVIETLAVGTPVVVSSKAGASEYFDREHGVVVADPGPVSLARALRSALASQQELRSAALACRSYLSSQFTWDVLARRWIEEVKKLGIVSEGGRR